MLIPATRYRDPEAAPVFSADVCWRRARFAARSDACVVSLAELSLGTGFMMLGPENETSCAARMVAPSNLCHQETTPVYAIVADVEACSVRAVADKADIPMPVRAVAHGGSSFALRDTKEHLRKPGDCTPGST